MLNKTKKALLKRAMRQAIKDSKEIWLFNCYDCRNCVDDGNGYECLEEVVSLPSRTMIAGPLMPACFVLNYTVDHPFGHVLEIMHELGIEFHEAEQGWGTYVIRMINRAGKFGHVMNLNPRNEVK